MLRNNKLTIRDAILKQYEEALKSETTPLNENQKADILFRTISKFIVNKNWKYSLQGRDVRLPKILGYSSHEPQSVNCMDLCHLFVKLGKKIGIVNYSIVKYSYKPSKKLGEKFSKDSPPLKCFDKMKLFHDNEFIFDMHSVVKVNHKFYDLTFSTSYSNINEPYEDSIFARIVSCICSNNEKYAITLLENNKVDFSLTFEGLNLLHSAVNKGLISLSEKLLMMDPTLANKKSKQLSLFPSQVPLEIIRDINSPLFELLEKHTDENFIQKNKRKHEENTRQNNLFNIASGLTKITKLKKLIYHQNLNINFKGENEWTLLHHAACYGYYNIASYLLDISPELANAKTSTTEDVPLELINDIGSPIFELIAKFTDHEVIEKIFSITNKSKMDPLFQKAMTMIEQEDLQGLSSIINDDGLDINYQDDSGQTLLHQAVTFERSSTVEWLLNNGSNKLLRRNDGKSAFELCDKVTNQKMTLFAKKHVHDEQLSLPKLERK